MAGEKPKKGAEKGGGRAAAAVTRLASSKGLGGSLLLGFSTCGNVAGETYIAPLHRLRGVTGKSGSITFKFEPLAGAVATGSDIIVMSVADEYATSFWSTIANTIGGRAAGDTFVWVQNECATDYLGNNQAIAHVTNMTITLAVAPS